MTTIGKARARQLAQDLRTRNETGESWRAIAASYGDPIVRPGTLCRIAKEGGDYLPDDRAILRALGLIEQRKRTRIQKAIDKMANETRKAVIVKK